MASLLFGLADKLTGELSSPLLRDYVEKHMEFGTQSEFEKLKNTVSAIKSVLLDAQEKERTNYQVQDWLIKIKLVFYDLEDLLQEFRTEDLKHRVLESKNKWTNKVRIFFSSSNQLMYPLKMGRKVKLIRETLDATASHGNTFNFTERREEMNVVGINRREETHSFVPPIHQLIGRDVDKECVIKYLLQSDVVDNVSAVSIVGIGGIGKTTLAQCVFISEEVKSKFELMMWVCVSDPFDVKLICEKIIEAATSSKCARLPMDGVKDELKKAIGGRKYLLVLDDVWNDSSTEWKKLEVLLSGGPKGCKILITARAELVARAARSIATHVLNGLSAEDSWWLFKQVAFKRGVEQESPTMERIGKEVLEQCAGVPLAVKVMGSLLAFTEKEIDWLDFIKNDLPWITQDTQDSESTVLWILKLSYDYLPAPLKRCFVYCAIYPKDHEIEKEELIGMWVAHGFIQLDSTTRSLEDVGEQYFMDLLDRSFFEVHKRAFIGSTCYKMHDLIHDLAQSLGGDEYYNLESDANYIGKSTRHTWVSGDKLTNICLDGKKLRTLVLTSSGDEQKFDELTSTFQQLRVLILRYLQLPSVPQFVGGLRHLYYLDLSENHSSSLPESICSLYNLQTLVLSNCVNLKELPEGTEHLVSLRRLDVSGCRKLRHMPWGLEKLTCLQTLILSNCINLENLPMETTDLVNLRHLDASGCSKFRRMPWGLEKLTCLETLILSDCVNLEELPWDTRDLVNLRHLDVSGCRKLKYMPQGLEKLACLQTLILSNCINLKKFPLGTRDLANLRHLDASGCSKLKHMPWALEKLTCLQTLILSNCINLENLPMETRDLVNLRHLDASGCSKFRRMPSGLEKLTCLETLILSDCVNLEELPAGTIKLVSLRHLDVSGCPKLRHMPRGLEELTRLHTLILSDCVNLEELPAGTRNLASLRRLDVSGCPKLRHMPRGLQKLVYSLDFSYTNIKYLPELIYGCVVLQKLKLKGCQLLMELGPEIGEFLNLEELDLEGTEIICLPKEIAKLINLKSLKFALCGYADQFQETKEIVPVIPQKALSNLLQLNELSIDVNPDGDWWNAEVKTVIDDLHCLQELKILRLYIPTVDLFGYLIQRIKLLIDQDSVCFRFTVGHHERLVSRLPEGVLKEFDDLEKFKKGLKFTSGEGISIEITNALQHMDALLLERHWSINNLLEFGQKITEKLKCCILSECNKLQTLIDTKQHPDYNGTVLGSLQHLSIHYMKSMQKIWRGPVKKGSLYNLKSLALYSCVSLATVFKIDMLANLVNLEELRIEDCPEIKTIVSSSFSDISPSQDFLPKLKTMLLLELPNLRCISNGLPIAPKLERLVILYCPNLKKLSTTEISSKDLQVLKGTKGWWDALKWYESDVTEADQSYLTSKFIPLREDGDFEEQFLRD